MNRRRRAFTLIELLVAIGIIGVLMGILLPALIKARAIARRTRVASDMRQLLLAYSTYASDHKGRLLPGFLPDSVAGTVRDPRYGFTVSGHAAARYPWRLMPYASEWRLLFDDAPLSPADVEAYAYSLSLLPRFGLNSVFVGGDHQYDGFYATGQEKPDSPAITRDNQAKYPSELIVFVETECFSNKTPFVFPTSMFPPGSSAEGLGQYFQALPPRYRGSAIWHVEGGQVVIDKNMILGAPSGKKPVTGFFDGHAEAKRLEDLQEMRLWTPRVGERG